MKVKECFKSTCLLCKYMLNARSTLFEEMKYKCSIYTKRHLNKPNCARFECVIQDNTPDCIKCKHYKK